MKDCDSREGAPGPWYWTRQTRNRLNRARGGPADCLLADELGGRHDVTENAWSREEKLSEVKVEYSFDQDDFALGRLRALTALDGPGCSLWLVQCVVYSRMRDVETGVTGLCRLFNVIPETRHTRIG
jgi:hypothetical protein